MKINRVFRIITIIFLIFALYFTFAFADSDDASIVGNGEGSGIFSGVGEFILDLPIISDIYDLCASAFDFIRSALSSVVDWLSDLWDSIVHIAENVVNRVTEFWRGIPQVIRDIADTISDILSFLGDFLSNLGNGILHVLSIISGYTLFHGLLTNFIPSSIADLLWTFWLTALGIGLFRLIADR